MSKTLYSDEKSANGSQIVSKYAFGQHRFKLLKFIAQTGECRLSYIRQNSPCEETFIDGVLDDLTRENLVNKNGSLGDHFYSINPEKFLNVLDDMSNRAKRCIVDSENLLLRSSRIES